jgi:hypothetical protein
LDVKCRIDPLAFIKPVYLKAGNLLAGLENQHHHLAHGLLIKELARLFKVALKAISGFCCIHYATLFLIIPPNFSIYWPGRLYVC